MQKRAPMGLGHAGWLLRVQAPQANRTCFSRVRAQVLSGSPPEYAKRVRGTVEHKLSTLDIGTLDD